MAERDVQKAICQYLDVKKYCYWRNYVGPIIRHDGVFTKNQMSGLPDIIGILNSKPGQMFAIEVKSKQGRLSKKQEAWAEALKKAGVAYIVANNVDIVMNTLEAIDR
jgi:hypothetical protein